MLIFLIDCVDKTVKQADTPSRHKTGRGEESKVTAV